MINSEREEILRRFTAWLDQGLAPEAAPSGVPNDILTEAAQPAGGDLYSVQAALTALTQEVKLQGRWFQQLSDAVAPALQPLAEQAREQAQREVLDILIDLDDRLRRGQQAALRAALRPAPPKRWWQRSAADNPTQDPIVHALLEGYELTLQRLAETLARYGVNETECLDQPFNPATMEAIAIEETTTVAEGTVVDVVRRGYSCRGTVYRPAQVRVARLPLQLEREAE